jgi:hypothetical protein
LAEKMVFLGHVIDPKKVKAMLKCERLANVSEIHSFLRLAEY